MATMTMAPQTAQAPVQEPPAAPRRARREIDGIPVGSATVVRDKGFSKSLYETIVEGQDWVAVAVRERQVVGINGVNFVVEGPGNDEAYETVTLPAPIAEILKEQRKHEQAARRTWRVNTARSLGGTLDVRER